MIILTKFKVLPSTQTHDGLPRYSSLDGSTRENTVMVDEVATHLTSRVGGNQRLREESVDLDIPSKKVMRSK